MFKWSLEYSFDVDSPIQKVWEFSADPSNWPKWLDKIESCHFEGELKEGSHVKAKVKNRFSKDIYLLIIIQKIKLYQESKILIKTPLLNQEGICTLQEVSPIKTRINYQLHIKSLFVPIMKSFFSKWIENSSSRQIKLFLAAIEQD